MSDVIGYTYIGKLHFAALFTPVKRKNYPSSIRDFWDPIRVKRAGLKVLKKMLNYRLWLIPRKQFLDVLHKRMPHAFVQQQFYRLIQAA